ncbi:MAG: A/G-specific adenine glycosylase [Clostridia bacterium]|nr:A/G-specific adenine glycosylase [Clostridia bacterium]
MRTDEYGYEKIVAPLLLWYGENKRDLPWRHDPTPYRVWVSEIMLQQTRVEAAKEYYLRFLSALPTVQDLAACEEEKLLKLWEGLGYYSRVRNMQKAAKIVVEKYQGNFPQTEKELKNLPGIGDYTVGAIRSIAFHKRAPAVDGNVFRVLSRISANASDISEPAYRAFLKEKLQKVYPEEGVRCSDFTQALMELGATVCKPSSPDCALCPLQNLCKAKEEGAVEKYPVLPEKKAKRVEQVAVFFIRTPKGIAVRKREGGILKGMNELPSMIAGESAPQEMLLAMGVKEFEIERERKFTHIFTHIKWEMTCYYVSALTCPFPVYTAEQIREEISLPTAFKQCLEGEV